jgi:nicotinamide mononucleotide transporter
MSGWEIAGFAAGAVSVLLYVRQSVWAWPVGIANSACWLVLFWSSRLYLNAGLQVLYIALGVIGWYWWLRGRDGERDLPVTRTPRALGLGLLVLAVVATLGLWAVMVTIGDASPFLDATTSVVSLVAQYMLTRKLVENWWLWIGVDVVYLFMYSSQQLYLTAALQIGFIALCVAGVRRWRASLKANLAIEPVAVT